MSYWLDELALIFAGLSPDQLVTARLVRAEVLTSTQVQALGRILQELHTMGLAYDLKELLLLLDMVTPEQLQAATVM